LNYLKFQKSLKARIIILKKNREQKSQKAKNQNRGQKTKTKIHWKETKPAGVRKLVS
jgi:hypothetical protein